MPDYARSAISPGERDTLPQGVVAELGRVYNLGEWLSWHRTPKGSSNLSFYITTPSGKHVLRRSNNRKTIDAIRFEVSLINFLRQSGYPAPEIIPTVTGEPYWEHDGAFYLVTAFISGSAYNHRNTNHLRAAASGLGLYHSLIREFPGSLYQRPVSALVEIGSKGSTVLNAAAPLARRFLTLAEDAALADAFLYLRSQFTHVHRDLTKVYPRLTKLIIQGSFGRSALIFDQDQLIGVVDYDRATYEVRGLDLAYTIKAFCRTDNKARPDHRVGLDYERTHEFLESYRLLEPLPSEESAAMPLIFRAQRLHKVLNKCHNFLTKNAVIPQTRKDVLKLATMAEREAVRLRWLEDHSKELLEVFTN